MTAAPAFSCQFCHSKFASRNAIFRHLRADGCTSDNPRAPSATTEDPIVKQSLAIWFGYYHVPHDDDNDSNLLQGTGIDNDLGWNEWAGQQVFQAVQQTLETYEIEKTKNDPDSTNGTANNKLLDFQLQESRTQCSLARLRARILQQDPECPAATDVLVMTGTCLQSSLPQLEVALTNLPDALSNGNIQIWACKLLRSDITLHAERSCTQMVYHYLVPLAWMPGAELLQTQWEGWGHRPPTDCLKRFKTALRGAECGMVPLPSQQKKHQQQHKMAVGRFGRLGAKERKAWHNFADPTLRGLAAPNQESVWRVVDYCRMVGMVDNANLVVEIKGDAFLPQQVRRILGTAVAMTHGWIPMDAWETALRDPASLIETVLAPPGRLYLSECRFHFEESFSSGKPLFESDTCGKVLRLGLPGDNGNTRPQEWAQQCLLRSLSSEGTKRAEDQWLKDVQTNVAPRATQSIHELLKVSVPRSELDASALDPAPLDYMDVLTKLRDIVSTGKWPVTSIARSSVLADQGGKTGKAGSFTVINSKLKEQLQTSSGSQVELPLGNQLFPDLAAAVFELEERIAEQTTKVDVAPNGKIGLSNECTSRRPQSTHCAINANAQFQPHVDSGRGAGQSLSIIVGLGDYHDGELRVEGLACDIRFKPLEFDGWALRHWTNQYHGERFSLVWFTPELT
ncbi:expressed unknown protein [Seminavis robusta]|uniref:C2H2-type domain-containing protein n=1 Tax=Seminavis robusta TaxID=568900 RepID=A0A9N8DBG4_9STRA|nr:expressed unknown protein [Seminavis robusta]|eukprot:Sro23_g016000.1 n/a (681) ;mRNA; r:129407-131449